MIEFLHFGEGFRFDGANWGWRARPYLDRPDSWRVLQPGKHILDNNGFNFYRHELTVQPDGRGSLSVVKDENISKAMTPATPFGAIGRFAMDASLLHIPIDETRRVMVVRNVSMTELASHIAETQDLRRIYDVIRLVGVVRFNPEGYTLPT